MSDQLNTAATVAPGIARAVRPSISADLRFEIADLYAEYAACLDQQRYKEWPEFFVDDAVYRIVPRENYIRGFPIATMGCESKGMIQDRAYAVEGLNMLQPRVLRHFVTDIVIESGDTAGAFFKAGANFLIVQTEIEKLTEVVMAGRYVDEIVRKDGRLMFQRRECVYDSLLIPTSLVAPV